MATADEYADWIVKNKDKRGTPAFETVAKAYQEAKADAPKPAEVVDPTEGMSKGQMLAAGYGSVVPRLWQSGRALVRDVAEFVPGGKRAADFLGLPSTADVAETNRLMAPLEQAGTEQTPRRVAVMNSEDPSKPARMRYEMRGTKSLPGPGSQGIALGNLAAAAPLAVLPGANTILGAGAYGAGFGVIQPAESWAERGKNAAIGGALSAGLTGAVRAVPAIHRGLIAPFTEGGQERIALEAIGRFSKDPDAVKNLSLANVAKGELIQGSKPTLAEVTGDPGIAQLQRSAQAASQETASLLAENKTARLQARKDALLSVAGQGGEKEAAEAVRDAAAQRLYAEAWKTPIAPEKAKAMQPEIKELMSRPSIQSAQKRALVLAKEEGEELTKKDLNGGSVKGLHYTKKAIDDQISEAKRAGNDNLVRLLVRTKEKFLNVVDELSPAYKQAREEFATASKPINRMEIGRYLYDKLVPALSDLGAEKSTPAAFARALKEGDEMAQKATGFKGAKLRDILTTDQMEMLVNLGKDVGREAGAIGKAAVPGSPTAQYLASKNALNEILNPLGVPKMFSGAAGDAIGGAVGNLPFGIGHWLSSMGEPAEAAIQGRLGRMLADPAQAVAASGRLAARNQRMIPLSQIGRYAVQPAIIGGSGYAATRETLDR
jgi:hypothetical protein